jgi:DNA-binding CsgD family transcriptional regulator
MHAFVETMLHRISDAKRAPDVDLLLRDLAGFVGYRSAYMLVFFDDTEVPIRLYDSNQDRAAWWRDYTDNGRTSVSRLIADNLESSGVQHISISRDDPRYSFAIIYDFAESTIVPVTFGSGIRGVVGLCGEARDHSSLALSLQIVCYALLMQARATMETHAARPNAILTPREREIMKLSAEGLTSETIAAGLGISARTVNQHIDNIATKLSTRNRVHTVAEAMRQGLLT